MIGAYGELVGRPPRPTARCISTDLMLVSCGIRPETGLAAAAGLPTGRGVIVGADLASPDDPAVRAIGDCAEPPEGVTGLVAPGWAQAERLARLLTEPAVGLGESADADAERRPPGGRPAQGRRGRPGHPRGARQRAPARRPGDRPRRPARPAATSRSSSAATGWSASPALGAPQVSASLSVAFERRTPLPVDPATLLLPPTGSSTGGTAGEASPTLIPADARSAAATASPRATSSTAWDDGCHTVEEIAATHPGDDRVRRLPRDGVRPRRLAHEQRRCGREHLSTCS